MPLSKAVVGWALLVLAASRFATPVHAQSCEPDCPPLPDFRYNIIDLGTFGSPGSQTFANASGINEAGHVAGIAEDDDIQPHGFLYRDGNLIDVGALSKTNPGSNAKGVNDLDQVVGQSMAAVDNFWVGHPFLWTEEDGMIDLAPEGSGLSGWAWGINNHTQVALTINGPYFWDPDTGLRQIIWPECEISCGGAAWEINDDGFVVGDIRDPETFLLHAFKYDSKNDVIIDLHDPSFRQSLAYGINELSDIVGWASILGVPNPPVLWPAGGSAIELPLGDIRDDLMEGKAEHINNLGDVVGGDDSVIPGVQNEAWVMLDAINNPAGQKLALEWLLEPPDQAAWELTAAFEINDARQITGIGIHNGLTRAYLMTPFPLDCSSQQDINGDGAVNAADLALLLGSWGPCPGCPADFNGDGDVDAADLAVLLGNWGPCE